MSFFFFFFNPACFLPFLYFWFPLWKDILSSVYISDQVRQQLVLAKPEGDKITLEPAMQAMMVMAEFDCSDEHMTEKIAALVSVRAVRNMEKKERQLIGANYFWCVALHQLALAIVENARSFSMDQRVGEGQ